VAEDIDGVQASDAEGIKGDRVWLKMWIKAVRDVLAEEASGPAM
jgi:hypothetical protein